MSIVVAATIIFFFDKHLFLYFLFSLPFFSLFYLLIYYSDYKGQGERSRFIADDFYQLLVKSKNSKNQKRFAYAGLEADLNKKLKTRRRNLPLTITMDSFINFYRLFYLAYFGVFIITYDFRIEGLIIGLLFITILIRPFISILKTIPYYRICSRSFYKINSLKKN
jgi:hypothetical protein